MCGICGMMDLREAPLNRTVLWDMIGAIRHRGPDECGYYVGSQVGFGHARLSIIDLSSGQQPMPNADGSIWITFNGEIFNYLELREELIRKGRKFATSSDTEVLLQLYEEEGERCVQRLNGQWAFAIWDAPRKKLFLCRDRLGVRPLFYCQAGGQFLFASEIKSLFAHPSVPRELDPGGLQQVFTFWHTVPPRTQFRGISELAPGHSLTVQNGEIGLRRWWQLDLMPDDSGIDLRQDRQEYLVEALGSLLVDATRIRLRADVPVGAYLSGGLDSSLITAIIRGFSNAPLETFSIAFDSSDYDESAYQREVVDHLGTTHHSIRCTHAEIGEAFPDAVWHAEKTLLRTAPVPMMILSRLVRQSGFKVVLTGEGADELFGGYDIFKETKIRSFWAAQPESELRPLLLRRLYPYMSQMQEQPVEYLRKFFRARPEDLDTPFFSHLPRWETTSRLSLLFSPELVHGLARQMPFEEMRAQLPSRFGQWDVFRRAQYLETAGLLPGYILSSQGDRAAMAHSVEGRFPFLDPRVVQFAASISPRAKMRGLNEKYILKRYAATLLPQSVLRRPKQPYRAPEVLSFFDPAKCDFRQAYLADLLSPEAIRRSGVFHAPAIQSLITRLRNQPSSAGVRDSMAITGVISTQLLIHQFITNQRGRTDGNHSYDAAQLYHRQLSVWTKRPTAGRR